MKILITWDHTSLRACIYMYQQLQREFSCTHFSCIIMFWKFLAYLEAKYVKLVCFSAPSIFQSRAEIAYLTCTQSFILFSFRVNLALEHWLFSGIDSGMISIHFEFLYHNKLLKPFFIILTDLGSITSQIRTHNYLHWCKFIQSIICEFKLGQDEASFCIYSDFIFFMQRRILMFDV